LASNCNCSLGSGWKTSVARGKADIKCSHESHLVGDPIVLNQKMADASKTVLIVGMGRSGTTLLAKILDSSPNVIYRHEPDFTNINTEIPFLPKSDDNQLYVSKAETYLCELTRQCDAKTSGTRPIFPKTFRSGFGNYAFTISVLAAKVLSRVGISVNVPDFVIDTEKAVYVVKSVNSLCRTELFLNAMTGIRVLHIIRHPCAVIASQLRGIKKGVMKDQPYIDALFDSGIADGYGVERESVKQKPFEEQLAFQWMAMNNFVFTRLNQDHRYMPIYYEQLCIDVLETTRSLFSFSGVEWSTQTDAFLHHLMGYENRDSGYFSIKKNLSSSLFNWRTELSEERIMGIKEIIKETSVGRQVLTHERQIENSGGNQEKNTGN
jgi:hypothetical protein